MDAPDELVEAIADAIHAAEVGWRSALGTNTPKRTMVARAVLSVPALAEVIARDAKVREIVEALADFKVVLPDAGPEYDARSMHDVSVLYPEAGK